MKVGQTICKLCRADIFPCMLDSGAACECGNWYDFIDESSYCSPLPVVGEKYVKHVPIKVMEEYVNG